MGKKICALLGLVMVLNMATAALAQKYMYRDGETGKFVYYEWDEEEWKRDIGYYKENDEAKDLKPDDK